MNIQKLRKNIDQLDQTLVTLLAKRKGLVIEVGNLKKDANLPPLDPARWQQVLDTRTAWGSEVDLDPHFVQDIFNRIHDYSLQIEGEICQK